MPASFEIFSTMVLAISLYLSAANVRAAALLIFAVLFSAASLSACLAISRTGLLSSTRLVISSSASLEADCKYSLVIDLASLLEAFLLTCCVDSERTFLVTPLIPALAAPAVPKLIQVSGSDASSSNISLPVLPVLKS